MNLPVRTLFLTTALLACPLASAQNRPAPDAAAQQPGAIRVMLTQDRVAGFAEHTRTMLGLFDTTGLVVARDRLLAPGSRRDPLNAVVDPVRRAAEGADFPGVKEPIVMLEVEGVSVAYPMSVLTYHGVVNDTIGATPVAIWHDPISNGIAAFRRDVTPARGGERDAPVEFRLAGLLLHGSSVLYDRASKSLFSPIEGRGLSGAFAGAPLEFLPFRVITFGEFLAIRKDGETISKPQGTPFDYAANPFGDFQREPGLVYMELTRDGRAHPKTPGVGIASGPPGSEAVFLPMAAIMTEDRTVMTGAGGVVVGVTPEGAVHVKECPPGAVVTQAYFANWVSAHTRSNLTLAVEVRDLPQKSSP